MHRFGFRFLGISSLASACAVWGSAAWRSIPVPPEPERIFSLAAQEDTIWAGMENGVRFSKDGGSSWSAPGTGMEAGKVVGLIRFGKRLLACQTRFIYTSDDGGRTWLSRDTLVGMQYLRMEARNDTLFAIFTLFNGTHPDGSRISTDGGSSWSGSIIGLAPDASARAFQGNTYSYGYLGMTLYRDSGAGPLPVLSLPDSIVQIETTSRRLFILSRAGYAVASATGTAPWNFLTPGTQAAGILSVAADSQRIAISTLRGLLLSRNRGRDWELLRPILFDPEEQRLQFGNRMLYVTTASSRWIHRYDLDKAEWDSVSLPGTLPNLAYAVKGDMIAYAGANANADTNANRNALYLSYDRGEHFVLIRSGWGESPMRMAWGRDALCAVSGIRLLTSLDTLRTWNAVGFTHQHPNAFAVPDSGFFYSGKDGRLNRGSEIRFVEKSLALPTIHANPLSLAGSGGSLYLGTTAGLWVWEESAPVSLAHPGRRLAKRHSHTLPVPIWIAPNPVTAGAPEHWIDAKGAHRRPRR